MIMIIIGVRVGVLSFSDQVTSLYPLQLYKITKVACLIKVACLLFKYIKSLKYIACIYLEY